MIKISEKREDKFWCALMLREYGKLGKRLFKLTNDGNLKNMLLKLHNFIENYETTNKLKT